MNMQFNLMKSPGFMSVLSGEVVHIIRCVPVEVSARKAESCFQQLPVFKGNESLFLAPKTHILVTGNIEIREMSTFPGKYRHFPK